MATEEGYEHLRAHLSNWLGVDPIFRARVLASGSTWLIWDEGVYEQFSVQPDGFYVTHTFHLPGLTSCPDSFYLPLQHGADGSQDEMARTQSLLERATTIGYVLHVWSPPDLVGEEDGMRPREIMSNAFKHDNVFRSRCVAAGQLWVIILPDERYQYTSSEPRRFWETHAFNALDLVDPGSAFAHTSETLSELSTSGHTSASGLSFTASQPAHQCSCF
jgi:hypothetical protein